METGPWWFLGVGGGGGGATVQEGQEGTGEGWEVDVQFQEGEEGTVRSDGHV